MDQGGSCRSLLISSAAQHIPKKWKNIQVRLCLLSLKRQAIHLKTPDSVSLPIYTSISADEQAVASSAMKKRKIGEMEK
jgi:hypothetical protein